MRVATHSVSDTIVRQIQQLGSQQAKLQNQVGTGQRVFEPEDDPSAVGRVLNLQTEQRQLDQYSRNADRALELSEAAHSGLQGLKQISDRATEIATLAGGVVSTDALHAYTSEVDQLLEQAVQVANSKLGNDYLFGGTAVDHAPFEATHATSGQIASVAYAGNHDRAEIPLSSTSSISPSTSGETNDSIGEFITHLIALRDTLHSGDTSSLSAVEEDLLLTENEFVSALGENGGVQTRIEANQAQQQDLALSLESLVSKETDADLPSTIVKLTQTQTAYQAALQSAATIMRLSLLDYIK